MYSQADWSQKGRLEAERTVRNLRKRPCYRPVLFAGDDAQAKETVAELVAKTGWTPVDVGPLGQALHLEHMTLMWITMVRVGGEPVGTVWGRVG